jgi:hypothetical protein
MGFRYFSTTLVGIKKPSTLGREGFPRYHPTWLYSPLNADYHRLPPLTLGLRFGLMGARSICAAFTRTAREGTSASIHCGQVSVGACLSLSTSADLLSSVHAFDWLACWLLLSAENKTCQGVDQSPHQELFNSHNIRRPSRVSHGARISITAVSFAIVSARPPVAMTFISVPSSTRKRSTIPSTMHTYP